MNMSRMIEGGIREHQDLTRFTASAAGVPAKDQIDLMSRNWFSLTPGRTDPIQHEYVDKRTKLTETVRITGSAEHGGIATIYDQDLLIFAISQWIDATRIGLETSRRIHFTPYQFFAWLNIAPHGTAYARLKDALNRLKMTNIQTTVRSDSGKRSRNRIRQFSWISEWEITEEQGEVRGVEVVLAEWLFDSIQDFDVLTLDKRYFEIPGSVERWLYRYARKATGGESGIWRETFKSLYAKSASLQEYKHFASALRKLVAKDNLPGLKLAKVKSNQEKDMLHMERTDKRQVTAREPKVSKEEQFVLIEKTPLEEAWDNVLEIMVHHVGAPTVNSWLRRLHFISLDGTTLTFRADTKFIAEHVETHFRPKLMRAWEALGHEVSNIRFEAKTAGKAA